LTTGPGVQSQVDWDVTVSIRGESYRLKEKLRAGLVKKREKVEV
jgi:hypothetical protein